jgi:two-component system cell cycle sensor histidine kinase/response regulator CckA
MNYMLTSLFRLGTILLLILLLPLLSQAESREVRIGIPGYRGTEQILRDWQSTADYLTATIPGYHFTIHPSESDNIEQAIASGKFEFALVNPAIYLKLEKHYRAQHLATLLKKVGNAEASRLGGVIFTRSDRSDINTLSDLKGKSIIATHETSFAGWQIALYELYRNGISPNQLKSLNFCGYPVDRVVMAVRNGEADAGTVRTDILEQMAAEGKINLGEFRILNRQETSGFPFLHSSRLYPEYLFASLGNTDPVLSSKVAAQLLLYPGGSRTSQTLVGGWTIPASNEDVRTLVQTLHLPPYENFGKVTIVEALRQHWGYFAAMGMFLALLSMLAIRLKLSSERVRHLTELEESNGRYRALFEDAGDYILVLSPPTEDTPPMIIDANTAAFERHGYTREEMVGKPVFFIDTPDAAAKNRDNAKHLTVHDGPMIFESEHLCKDGSTFPVEVSLRMIKSGEAPPIILAIERDITERKHAETALRRSEERFRVLFDKVANIAVQGYAPDGTVCFWNRASEELYGYSSEEATGRSLLDLIIPPAMKSVVSDAITFMFATGEGIPSGELSLMRKDGSFVPVYSNHTVLEITGYGKELYCLDIDLSELKEAQVRIEHLNRILRTLRSVDRLILQEKNLKSLIEKACDILVEYRGYTSAMIIVMDQEWTPDLLATSGPPLSLDSPANSSTAGYLLPHCCQKAILSDKALLINTQSELCRDCVSSPHSAGDVICSALRYEATLYGCIKASSENIDSIDEEEKALFENLAADIAFALHAMEQEHIMGQVMAEKDRVEAEMRQAHKMEAVGRLAGGIAHDFNNKLTVILCTAELALSKTAPESLLHKDILAIKKAGEQSASLTRQLLAFSRKQFVNPKIVCLNEYIATEIKFLSRLIGEEINIQFIPVEERTEITIDPSQLDQILANLMVNARDAISNNGDITVETSTITIDDRSGSGLDLTNGDYVILTFSDNGSGMDEETQKLIFDPFFTTKPEGKGTGLGLSTVYGIVKQNNGAIYVESNPGKGTSFRLYFPRCQGKDNQTSEITSPTIPVGVGTILVVEDNEPLLNLIEAALSAKGYQVLATASPEEACRICDAYGGEIHLLLTDIIMPTMNGKELQVQIEMMRPGIKTIFMSGFPSEIISDRGIDETKVHFLPKPFTIDPLQHKVYTVLHGEFDK